MSDKYDRSYGQSSRKSQVTRNLIQGSAKKAERMEYADPDDHQFNSSQRFTNRNLSPFRINNADLTQMPPVKNFLPRVSPLNNDDEDELVTLLKEIIEHEREIEDARISLA